jgi:hypothetical protein
VNGFLIDETGEAIARAARSLRKPLLAAFEVEEMQAQCRAKEALCFYGPQGVLVVSLRPFGENLELFILMAVVTHHGAIERLEPAVQQLARDLGAHTIAFETRRKGWVRRLDSRWQRRGTLEFMRYVDGWRSRVDP